MWWLCFPIIIGVLWLAQMIIGRIAVQEALFPKKRDYETVLYQDKKFGIPENISVLPYEKIVIKGCQGYDMVASYMKARTGESHKYFLICHGYNSNRVTCNKYANVLLDLGYNTICPDMRRCGETGGVGITFGLKESQDIELWIDYIYKMDPKAEISLYGISLGAASCVMVASKRTDIKLLVSYCSYASLRDIMVDRIVHVKIPKFCAYLIYPFIRCYTAIRFGNMSANTNIAKCISKVNCPTIIMHSNGDRFTNIRHAYMLHKAKPDATFVEFDDAPHARSYGVYPTEYQDALRTFVTLAEKGERMEDRHITKESAVNDIKTSSEDDNMTL